MFDRSRKADELKFHSPVMCPHRRADARVDATLLQHAHLDGYVDTTANRRSTRILRHNLMGAVDESRLRRSLGVKPRLVAVSDSGADGQPVDDLPTSILFARPNELAILLNDSRTGLHSVKFQQIPQADRVIARLRRASKALPTPGVPFALGSERRSLNVPGFSALAGLRSLAIRADSV